MFLRAHASDLRLRIHFVDFFHKQIDLKNMKDLYQILSFSPNRRLIISSLIVSIFSGVETEIGFLNFSSS